jgi:hypothetical protein
MCRNDRILKHLIPNAFNGDVNSKHAAGICNSGKIISFGNNHMRNMNGGRFMLSVHAEQHAIMKYLSMNNLDSLRRFINDESLSHGGYDKNYCLLCVSKYCEKV